MDSIAGKLSSGAGHPDNAFQPPPEVFDTVGRRTVLANARGRLAGASLSIYTSFADCEPVWRRAEGYCSGFLFQSFEWQSTWQRTIGVANKVEPHIVVVCAAGGRVLLLLPLGIYRHRGLRVLRFLGDVVTDYNTPLVERGFAAEINATEMTELWSAIRRRLPRVDLVWLWRMPASIEGVPNPMIKLAGAAHTDNSFAAILPSSMAEFRKSHAVNWPDTRRRRRRLAERGGVAFDIATDSAAKHDVLERLARHKSRRWRDTGARDLFARPEYLKFYTALTDTSFAYGDVHIASLRVDGRIVAAHWGIIHGDRFYYLVPAFDAEWSGFSVGRLLLEDLVEWCIRETDIGIFDMTAGGEAYKREWTDHSMPLYGLIAPGSLAGRLFVAGRCLREWLKRHRGLRNFVRRFRGKRPRPDELSPHLTRLPGTAEEKRRP